MERTDETHAPEKNRVLFYAEMRPHRSLSPAGFWILMAAIGGVSFTIGILFLLVGAWPVFGFFGLDILLIYIFFRLNYRQARAFETLTLTETGLLLRKVTSGGEVWSHCFEPYWLRVNLDHPRRHENRLTLSSHGQTTEIGAFLTPDEKRDLALEIREAIRLRQAVVLPAPDLI